MNETKTISWHHVAIPTQIFVTRPRPLFTMGALGYLVYSNFMFIITSGNEEGYFDLVRQGPYQAVLRVARPIKGPREFQLRITLENLNAINRLISRQVAFITIYVGPYPY